MLLQRHLLIGLLVTLGACGTKAVPSYSGAVLQVPGEDTTEPQRPVPAAFVHLRWTDDGVFDLHPNGQCAHSEVTTTREDGWFTSKPWVYEGGARRKLRSIEPSTFVYSPGFTAVAQLPRNYNGKDDWLKPDTGTPIERLEHIGWSIDYLETHRCPNGARILAPLYARITQEVRDLGQYAPEQARLLLDRMQRTVSNKTMEPTR